MKLNFAPKLLLLFVEVTCSLPRIPSCFYLFFIDVTTAQSTNVRRSTHCTSEGPQYLRTRLLLFEGRIDIYIILKRLCSFYLE